MNIEKIVKQIKGHPNYSKVGMVLYHNGVVRATSRDGLGVKGLLVEVDQVILNQVIKEHKKRDGIVEIIVKIDDGRNLSVGDDVMFIAVAGDIRENVIATLADVLDIVKRRVTKKTEFFV